MTSSPTRAMSRVQFGTDHYDLVLRPDVVRIVEDLTWYLDEPFGDTSAIPTYMVSKLASRAREGRADRRRRRRSVCRLRPVLVEDRERALRQPCRARSARSPAAVGAVLPDGTRGKRFLQHFGARRHSALPRCVDDVPGRRTAPPVPARRLRADRAPRSPALPLNAGLRPGRRLARRRSVLRSQRTICRTTS